MKVSPYRRCKVIQQKYKEDKHMDYTASNVAIEQERAPKRCDMFRSYQQSDNDKLKNKKKEGKENA